MLSRPPNISLALSTLSLTWPVLFFSIPCWIKLRALANFSIFSFCSLRSWRMSLQPTPPKETLDFLFLKVLSWISMNNFTSASCVEKLVGIVGNGYTLAPQSYSSSLRSNLCLADPGIQGRAGLFGATQTPMSVFNTHFLIEVPKGVAPYIALHTTSAELSSHQPRFLMGRKDTTRWRTLPVGYHTGAISWTVLSRRLQRFCSVLPWNSIHQFALSSIQERVRL